MTAFPSSHFCDIQKFWTSQALRVVLSKQLAFYVGLKQADRNYHWIRPVSLTFSRKLTPLFCNISSPLHHIHMYQLMDKSHQRKLLFCWRYPQLVNVIIRPVDSHDLSVRLHELPHIGPLFPFFSQSSTLELLDCCPFSSQVAVATDIMTSRFTASMECLESRACRLLYKAMPSARVDWRLAHIPLLADV